jgi:hypothetical protein
LREPARFTSRVSFCAAHDHEGEVHDDIRVARPEARPRRRVEHVAAPVGDLLPAARRRIERPPRHAEHAPHLGRALERRDTAWPISPVGPVTATVRLGGGSAAEPCIRPFYRIGCPRDRAVGLRPYRTLGGVHPLLASTSIGHSLSSFFKPSGSSSPTSRRSTGGCCCWAWPSSGST